MEDNWAAVRDWLARLLAELGTMAEVWTAAAKAKNASIVPAGRDRPVMLLPGFGAPLAVRLEETSRTKTGRSIMKYVRAPE